MDKNKRSFRFTLLVVSCFMTLGSYYCIDLVTVLQPQLQGVSKCDGNSSHGNDSCCPDCLGLTPAQFNIMITTRAWTATCFVGVSGFLIDKIGNRVAGIVFSMGILLGNTVFALASLPMLRHTAAMFPVMLVGRVLLGLSDFPTRIVQDRITAYWFRGRELSTAFGVTLTASRIGSVFCFLLTPSIVSRWGLSWALLTGVFLCVIAFIAALVVISLDAWGTRAQATELREVPADDPAIPSEDSGVLSRLRRLGPAYWCMVVAVGTFYGSIMPFMFNSVGFLTMLRGLGKAKAVYIVGAVYDVSIPLSPLLGLIVDRFGGRRLMAVLVGLMLAPCYAVLAFTTLPPLVVYIYMGVVYTCCAVAVWSCVPLLVTPEVTGLALGFVVASTGFTIGITNLVIGAILGNHHSVEENEMIRRYRLAIIPVTVTAPLCACAAILAVVIDSRKGSRLAFKRRQSEETEPLLKNGTVNSQESERNDEVAEGQTD